MDFDELYGENLEVNTYLNNVNKSNTLNIKKEYLNFYANKEESRPVISEYNQLVEKMEYRKKDKSEKRTRMIENRGQRKLLISEINFFNKILKSNDENIIVIYIGASSGYELNSDKNISSDNNTSINLLPRRSHLNLLKYLYPNLEFILIDPVNVDYNLLTSKNIFIKDYASVKLINTILNSGIIDKDFVIISDIRSSDDKTMSNDQIEKCVIADMKLQYDICELVKKSKYFRSVSLKFRLPYYNNKITSNYYNYYDGSLYLQPWNRRSSTETRLFTNCKDTKNYDIKLYEEKFYYFNNMIRPYNKNDIKLEEEILKNYFVNKTLDTNLFEDNKNMKLLENISQLITNTL